MALDEQVKLWARALRAIAQSGLHYGRDVYDKERYEQMNALSEEMLSVISGKAQDEIARLLPVEVGYATPKVAVRGLVLKDGKVLMVKEAADGKWTIPGGWCDIGLSASENIVKEVKEETGLDTKVTKLLAVFDQSKHRPSATMQHIYTVYFLCELTGGEMETSVETTAVDFFEPSALPELSESRMTEKQFKKAMDAARTGAQAYFE